MATGQLSGILRHLRTTVLLPNESGMSDGQLLERFINRRDEGAFAALVQRHGPMVWAVCRRVLHSGHDAEDAFQATFLVFVRKAASIGRRELVGNWLYGTAYRAALESKAAARRRGRERQVSAMPEAEARSQGSGVSGQEWGELQSLLDQELSRLPEKYRAPVVLCELEGRPRREVARQLGIPEGTLSSRLATARRTLAQRLARHGFPLTGGVLVTVLSQEAAASVPAALVSSAIQAASSLAAGQAAAAGAITVNVAALTEGVLKTMLLAKLKSITITLLILGCGVGMGLFAYHAAADAGKRPQATAQDREPSASGKTALQPSAILKKAREAADAIEDKLHKARALQAVGTAHANAGDKVAAARTFQDAIQAAAELPEEAKDQILTSIVAAQARAGDFKGAQETALGVVNERWRDYAGGLIGAAQAAAGDIKGALKIADEVSRSQRVNVLRAVATSQAGAGNGQEAAQTAAMLEDDYDRALTLLSVAKAHMKAKNRDAAQKNLQQGQQIVQGLDEGSNAKIMASQYVVEAQAELGDVKAARQTADGIANETLKNMALGKIVAAQAKAGDHKAALQTAEALQDEKQKRDVLAYYILPAQLRSGDVKAGQETAEALQGDRRHVLALGEIAKAQTQAGDRAAAADSFKKAFEAAWQLTDEEPASADLPTRHVALCGILRHQAEAGEEAAAFDWALKQSSPLVRASALLNIARGMALRKESEKKPQE